MSLIDLSDIHFRAYLPQWDRDLGDNEYTPVGPGDANVASGVDLSAIKFRAWQRNDLTSDQTSGGDGGGSVGDGSGPGGDSGGPIIWPNDELIPTSSASTTITNAGAASAAAGISEVIGEPNKTNANANTQSLTETYNGSVTETNSQSSTAIINIDETITAGGGDENYGDGNYGAENYGE